MIKKYNNISLLTGIPGLLLQIGGTFVANSITEKATLSQPLTQGQRGAIVLAQFVALAGTVLFFMGLAYYAKAKNRSPWWCLMALLSCLGLLILACLKDLDQGEMLTYQDIPSLDPLPDQDGVVNAELIPPPRPQEE